MHVFIVQYQEPENSLGNREGIHCHVHDHL
jgi:hypothetical protein